MGIIKKQAIAGSFWAYAGVVLGFVNLAVLSQRFMTTEEVGLTQVLLSFASIFSQIGSLGMGNVAVRLFPQFRNESNKHNGFIALSILVCLFGFLLMCLITFLFKPVFVQTNATESVLLTENYFYIYPLIFFMLFFSIFDSYNRMLFKAVMGTFLRDFFLRILNTITIVLFIFKIVDFEGFVLLFVVVQAIPTIVLTYSLWKRNQLTFKIRFDFINEGLFREIKDVALFGIIAGMSGMALQNIDRIMVSRLIGLEAAGVYSVTFFFATLILISQRAISNISTTVIAESWKRNDLATISDIYVKSSINQFILGVLVFIGIWGNIDNVFLLLKPEYENGKWVIFFIGMSNLVTVLSGVAIYILASSKYYRYHMWLMLFLIGLVIGTNWLLIPIWGLNGAAVASLISMGVYNLIVCFFLYRKFKIHPLRYHHLGIVVAGLVAYFVSNLIAPLSNYLIDIAVRSSVITAVFVMLIVMLKSSDEVNGVVRKIIRPNK
jgi:O-antigen/teichoic acid export membrane protein